MESILIMGSTTFVSSFLAKYLIGQGYNVDILTRGFKLLVEDRLYIPNISLKKGLERAYGWHIDRKPNVNCTAFHLY